jgi:hypothetical protein
MKKLEALRRNRNQFHLKTLLSQRYQGNKKQIFRRMTQLQNLNLPKDFTMMLISLETKMIQFFENLNNAFQMVIMVNGQASMVKVILYQRRIDICSGMSNTGRRKHLTRTTGILTQMIS